MIVRRQVVSQELLAKSEKGTLKPQDTKNLKQLTKTIIDRFFDSSLPPGKVQVYLNFTLTINHTRLRRDNVLLEYLFNVLVILILLASPCNGLIEVYL